MRHMTITTGLNEDLIDLEACKRILCLRVVSSDNEEFYIHLFYSF